MKKFLIYLFVFCAGTLLAEEQIVNGQKWICKDGICMPADSGNKTNTPPENAGMPNFFARIIDGENGNCENGICESPNDAIATAGATVGKSSITDEPRVAQGYMNAGEFLAFLENPKNENRIAASENSALKDKAWWLILLLVLLGGVSMNLTPCVLPMIPVNLMIVGRSAMRGTLYGLGIALAYGTLGLLAAIGGLAFGEIQANPWFNAAIAILFLVLALSMLGVFFIDFSKKRASLTSMRSNMWPGVFAFFMGVVCAVLAGACVAPILIAVLLLTADMFARGEILALALPFVLGLGMALPWPFAGAGLQILPKPGAWMEKVNKIFGIVVLGFAAYYGSLAYKGFAGSKEASPGSVSTIEELATRLGETDRPVLVDCWATWCKNCTAMEQKVFPDAKVRKFLNYKGFTVIRLQCENGVGELVKLPGCGGIKGLPAFLIFE